MKKNLVLIGVVLIMVFSVITVNADLGTYSWEGEWDSNWGKMVITQNGNIVTGTYTHDNGKISGTVSGSTFTGTWSEAPSYAPDKDAGDMELTMSADGMSFTGKWRYGSSGSWGNWEGGKRTTAVKLAPSEDTSGKDLEYRTMILQIDNPMMTVNGVQQEIDPGRGTVPILLNGRTVLPIRAVIEALGGTIGWDGNDNKVTINVRNTTLELWLDKTIMKSGGIEKQIDVAPTAINGRTMVPVRFIIDNIPGCLLEWKNDTRSAIIKY